MTGALSSVQISEVSAAWRVSEPQLCLRRSLAAVNPRVKDIGSSSDSSSRCDGAFCVASRWRSGPGWWQAVPGATFAQFGSWATPLRRESSCTNMFQERQTARERCGPRGASPPDDFHRMTPSQREQQQT